MDKYKKIKLIGEGAFGKAILASVSNNRSKQVVLKEVNMARMSKKEKDEARKEVAVLAQLKHLNVVSYLESFEDAGNLYIVMDYCDGGDLFGKINAQRELFPEEQVLDWFVQMCLAVKHIHDRKILHRDIKSQNIFLTKRGIIKLGDFGISKVLNSTVELAQTCIGTPYYLSPEICEAKPYNNKSDIWSLGCVLYELTTLKHPFEAASMKMLVIKITRAVYAPPSNKYSLELRNLIAQLFKKFPRERPSIRVILEKPLLQERIKKFLSDLEIRDEFSHTVMHGVKIQKVLPSGDAARPLPPKPVQAQQVKKPQNARQADIAAIYGQPVARRSKEYPIPSAAVNRRPVAEVKKSVPGGVGGRRPSNGGGGVPNSKSPSTPTPQEPATPPVNQADFLKRRQEFLEKEKERRDEVKRKQSRMNQQREVGWKNIVDVNEEVAAVNGGSDGSLAAEDSNGSAVQQNDPAPSRNSPVSSENGVGYVPVSPSAIKQAQVARNAGAQAAEIAQLEEFRQRKHAAAVNKARARGLPMPAPLPVLRPIPVQAVFNAADANNAAAAASPKPKDNEKKKEDEYLAKLRQIRQQNLNDKHGNMKDRKAVNGRNRSPNADQDLENRRKKVEDLKAQAEDRAKRLKDELEKRRKENAELDRKQGARAGGSPKSHSPSRKDGLGEGHPAIGMTAALAAIGTPSPPSNVISASIEPRPLPLIHVPGAIILPDQPRPILAGPDVRASLDSREKTPLQKTKDEILKRINSKPPTPLKPDKPNKWQVTEGISVLAKMDLEYTASVVSEDPPTPTEEVPPVKSSTPPRRQWTPSRGTVVNVLNRVTIKDTTANLDNVDSGGVVISTNEKSNRSLNSSPVTRRASLISNVELDDDDIVLVNNDNRSHTDGAPSRNVPEAFVSTKPPLPTLPQESVNTSIHKSESYDRLSEPAISTNQVEAKSSSTNQGRVILPNKVGNLTAFFNQLDSNSSTNQNPAVNQIKPTNQQGPNQVLREGLTTGQFDAADVKMLRTCSVPDLNGIFQKKAASQRHRNNSENADDVVDKEADSVSRGVVSGRKSESTGNIISSSGYVDDSLLDDYDDILDDDYDDEDDKQIISEGQRLLNESVPFITSDEEYNKNDDDEADKNDDNDDDVRYSSVKRGSWSGNEFSRSRNNSSGAHENNDSDENDDCDNESEEEDLRTMTESLANILNNKDIGESDDEIPLSASVKKKKKKKKKGKLKKKKTKNLDENDVTENGCSSLWRNSSYDELDELKATMKSVLLHSSTSSNAVKQAENKMSALSTIDEASSVKASAVSTAADINKSSQGSISNSISINYELENEDRDDEYFEDEDMFARLEEIRAKLEEELGCEKFALAYRAVQSLQSNESDMDEGIKNVTEIIGPDKISLYPQILHLVISDGAFIEDDFLQAMGDLDKPFSCSEDVPDIISSMRKRTLNS